MNNNTEFIKSFNKIEKYLEEAVNAQGHLKFYELLELNQKNKIVSKYTQDLKILADLRNIVVHGEIDNPIAVPSKESVEKIVYIENQLYKPNKVKDLFGKNIKNIDITDSLSSILEIISKYGYSQFPVIEDGKFIGLLTENGIVNWLSRNIDEDIVSIKDTNIKDVMENDEESKNYDIAYSNDTVYDILEKYDNDKVRSNRTHSIIILNSPKDEITSEDIYTILTNYDLELIYKTIDNES